MKYILIISLLFCSNVLHAQKDSTQKDTAAVLTYAQAIEVINYMYAQAGGKVDVKPETWSYLIQMLNKSIRIIDVPKKEKPKK